MDSSNTKEITKTFQRVFQIGVPRFVWENYSFPLKRCYQIIIRNMAENSSKMPKLMKNDNFQTRSSFKKFAPLENSVQERLD